MNVRSSARLQRGLSLVEMMVGVAVGLVVVAGASLLVSGQLVENRRLLVETQLQQDLRASADIIVRELRRAGAQKDLRTLKSLWFPGKTASTEANAFASSLAPTANDVGFSYQPTTGADGLAGFKLEGDAIKTLLPGNAAPQELTDSNVMIVDTFGIEADNSAAIRLPCPKQCADGTSDCWPSVQVRELAVTITAKSRNFPKVVRTITSNVRLRNDYVQFFKPVTNEICPP